MLLRQALSALLLIGEMLVRPMVWLALGILVAGYDIAWYLALPIIRYFASMTDFGIGPAAPLVVSDVRQVLFLAPEFLALLLIARSLHDEARTMPPPWYGSMVGYVVLPSLILSAFFAFVSWGIMTSFPIGNMPLDLDRVRLLVFIATQSMRLVDFVVQLCLIVPACLAVARGSGDRTIGLRRVVQVGNPPAAAWFIAVIAVLVGFDLFDSFLHVVDANTGFLSVNQRVVLNLLLHALGTTMRFAVAAAIYQATAAQPVRLGGLFE